MLDTAVAPIYFDTETCGFHGPAVLIQWAEGDGPIELYSPWTNPVIDTLKLIEKIAAHPGGVVGFNLAFDWFHLCQLYTTLLLLPDHSAYPEDLIDDYAKLEPAARGGPCLKPVSACDLMLHARKGPYQSTMNRGDVRIRRVPTPLAWQLAKELEKRVQLSSILFARKKNKFAPRWNVYDIKDAEDEIDPDFKDVVLSFAPSAGLKVLAADALDLQPETIHLFADVELEGVYLPEELGYAPYALAVAPNAIENDNWKGAWPDVISHHIRHWTYNKYARAYAEKDVELTRGLYIHFGSPVLGDDDSVLACMVGAVRWKGYRIDEDGIKRLKVDAKIRQGKFPTAPAPARRYIEAVLTETDKAIMKGSTKKTILEELAKRDAQPCATCEGLGAIDPDDAMIFADGDDGTYSYEEKIVCPTCNGVKNFPDPVAIRASEVLNARKAGKELELYNKLLTARRFHASFVVIGTLSSRMAGSDKLNAQGIKRDKEVRRQFPLADPGSVLCGGDFAGFEVVLAEACYNDPDLRRDLQSGKKIHGLFGQFVYPHMTYEEILKDLDIYSRCKSAVFAMLYGGEAFTLKERLGVPIEQAQKAYEEFGRRYPGVARARQTIIKMFSALTQARAHGQISWTDPADYIESMMGFKRFFTLENQIIRALFDLANAPPKDWKDIRIKVQRDRNNPLREQTAAGACQSALFGAAFALQSSNIRAAANHVIQSSGATITKMVQRKIWELQPAGVNDWSVQPMNVHDEIMCPTKPELVDSVTRIVMEAVEEIRPQIPLIAIEWEPQMKTWADK